MMCINVVTEFLLIFKCCLYALNILLMNVLSPHIRGCVMWCLSSWGTNTHVEEL
jgi:hypothetical protein